MFDDGRTDPGNKDQLGELLFLTGLPVDAGAHQVHLVPALVCQVEEALAAVEIGLDLPEEGGSRVTVPEKSMKRVLGLVSAELVVSSPSAH